MATILAALPWGDILGALGSFVVILIGLAANKLRAAQSSADASNKAASAVIKLGILATTLAGKAWDKLSPEIQKVLADGKITSDERAELEAVVRGLLGDVTSQDTLKALADALGLPLPGLIAKIASMLIDIFTKAHDPAITAESAMAYPVAEPDEQINKMLQAGG